MTKATITTTQVGEWLSAARSSTLGRLSKPKYNLWASIHDKPTADQILEAAHLRSWTDLLLATNQSDIDTKAMAQAFVDESIGLFVKSCDPPHTQQTYRDWCRSQTQATASRYYAEIVYDSWAEAVAANGGQSRAYSYASDGTELKTLKQMASSLARAPTENEYDRERPDGTPSTWALLDRYGNWGRVISEAKLTPGSAKQLASLRRERERDFQRRMQRRLEAV
jgi:hypothetical protein